MRDTRVSLTAPVASVALRAAEAAKQTKSRKPCVNDVMALLGVNDVVALKTYAPGFMLSSALRTPLNPGVIRQQVLESEVCPETKSFEVALWGLML